MVKWSLTRFPRSFNWGKAAFKKDDGKNSLSKFKSLKVNSDLMPYTKSFPNGSKM